MLRSSLLFMFSWLICRADELISARCQSKCLSDMESRYQDNYDQRRNLKHHIIQMCKDEATCSACTIPCRESFNDVATCRENLCKETVEKNACEASCEYIQRIYTEKPGVCPKMKNQSKYECSALCHLDGDCRETAKCCSYGCSRQCVLPRSKDPRLLLVPLSISIQERKRKRSIIIRWVMQKMTREQLNANSNLFVVQWRWGLHSMEGTMTEWQTVTVRNKPYAILKHLLSPGRFYQFRVGAVNLHGSLGFSKPSDPFKLSKEARAPSAPKDISLGVAKLTPVGLWNQILQWNPPESDLPIRSYQLSWSVSSDSEANAFEDMMRRRATLDMYDKRSVYEDEDGWGINGRDRHSVIVPSHSTHSELAGLFPNSVYIVEVHASVDSSEGELHGEKGIIFIRTAGAHISSSQSPEVLVSKLDVSTTNNEDINKDEFSINQLDIQTPFYDGSLQVEINWINTKICSPKKNTFLIKVRKSNCSEYQLNQLLDTRWQDLRVEECTATLRDLSFDCDYNVEILEAGKTVVSAAGTFSTEACELTPSHSPISCASLTSPLFCAVHSSAASCHWTKEIFDAQETIIGYRVLLSSPTRDTVNITINPPQLREVYYDSLDSSATYKVDVQSITNRGMGEPISINFVTPPRIVDEDLFKRFPGGEIIELPLESSRSPDCILFHSSLLFSLLTVLLNYNFI